MRAVIQRAAWASVTLKETGERQEIGPGLATLLGVAPGDTVADAEWLAEKLVGLRVFEDEESKMNLSLRETGGAMLVVSQFTLLGDARRGRRPSFTGAAPPAVAQPLYEAFVRAVRALGVEVKTGEFGADMRVEIANDGPVTLVVETPGRGPDSVPPDQQARQNQHLALHPDALDRERQTPLHLLGQAGGQGIGLSGHDGGRQGKAADLGVSGGVAQPHIGVGCEAAVNLDVLRAVLDGDGGADRQVCRLRQDELHRLDAARGQQLAGGLISGEGDVQVLFGEA